MQMSGRIHQIYRRGVEVKNINPHSENPETRLFHLPLPPSSSSSSSSSSSHTSSFFFLGSQLGVEGRVEERIRMTDNSIYLWDSWDAFRCLGGDTYGGGGEKERRERERERERG